MQLKDLVVFGTVLLLKPSFLRQIDDDQEEYAPSTNFSSKEIKSPAIVLNDLSKWGIFV